MGTDSNNLQQQYKAFTNPNAMFGGNLGANGSGVTGSYGTSGSASPGGSYGAPSSISNQPTMNPVPITSPGTPVGGNQPTMNPVPFGSNPGSSAGTGSGYGNYGNAAPNMAAWFQSLFGNGGNASGKGTGV